MGEFPSFLGTGWGFPPTFSKVSRSVVMLSGEEDINSSLDILLGTSVGERVMNHAYGCNLEKLLFEPLDTTLQAYMEDLIGSAILFYEPRILLDRVVLIPDQNEGVIRIRVEYQIPTTNTRTNHVYPYYLNEGAPVDGPGL